MKAPLFETQPCNRCGGSGEYSYCTMYGTMCFGCSGKGFHLTKAGKKAYELWVETFQKKVKASELEPGMKVMVDDGLRNTRSCRTIKTSTPDELNPGRWMLKFEPRSGRSNELGGYGGFPDQEWVLPATREEKMAAYETVKETLKGKGCAR